LFVGVFVSTPSVGKFSTSASTATGDRFAVARYVGITTGGLNAMRLTAITKARAKAERLMPSVKKSTANVSAWLEVRPR
jgi:hypothetical protein